MVEIPSIVPVMIDNKTYLILDPGDKLDHISHEVYMVESFQSTGEDGQTSESHEIKKRTFTTTGLAYGSKDEAIKKAIHMLVQDWSNN